MANEALLLNQEDDDRLDDQTIMLYLNDTQRERFVKMQETFETEGWTLIREWFQYKSMEALQGGANATTWETNREQYGARQAFNTAATLDDSFMNEFEAVAQSVIASREEAELADSLDSE